MGTSTLTSLGLCCFPADALAGQLFLIKLTKSKLWSYIKIAALFFLVDDAIGLTCVHFLVIL